MSAAAHEHAARDEDAQAKSHAADYDPRQSTVGDQCRGGSRAVESAGLCWSSVTNPTEKHRAQAAAHRKAAADHRAAAHALVDAEARACGGIAPPDRDMSPFEHAEDIVSVEPLEEPVAATGARSSNAQLHRVGAIVTFRAVPGMTAEWLQHLVECHLARAAALGNDVPEMPSCPLVPKGTTARVTSTGNGFAVAIRADTEAGAQEVLRRAEAARKP